MWRGSSSAAAAASATRANATLKASPPMCSTGSSRATRRSAIMASRLPRMGVSIRLPPRGCEVSSLRDALRRRHLSPVMPRLVRLVPGIHAFFWTMRAPAVASATADARPRSRSARREAIDGRGKSALVSGAYQGGAATQPPEKERGGGVMTKLTWIIGAVLAAALTAPPSAADAVKIGVIFPLSGNAGAAGTSAKDAVELAAEIVNTAHPELKGLPLAETGGLPNLGGAKIELVVADHQGNPATGQQQTLRLITQEKVVAMLGAYQSSVTSTATQVSERYGIPWVVGDSVAADITNRGFKWVFRVTPVASDFATNYMLFLNDMKKAGHKVESIAIVNENTDYGTSVAGTVTDAP